MGAVSREHAGSGLFIQLRNPGRANAIDLAMLKGLEACMDYVDENRDVRVVVLRGTPGGTFSSGADINDWSPLDPPRFRSAWIDYGNAIFDRFERLRCPTVAAVEGLCFGGGFELALAADLRVGTPQACFRFPEVGIGALPGWHGGRRLERLVGRGRALEAILCCRHIAAGEAAAWGILNALWPQEEFERQLQTWLASICALSPRAQELAKASLIGADGHGLGVALAAEILRASGDAAIGLRAFAQKTKPTY